MGPQQLRCCWEFPQCEQCSSGPRVRESLSLLTISSGAVVVKKGNYKLISSTRQVGKLVPGQRKRCRSVLLYWPVSTSLWDYTSSSNPFNRESNLSLTDLRNKPYPSALTRMFSPVWLCTVITVGKHANKCNITQRNNCPNWLESRQYQPEHPGWVSGC